MPKYLRSLCFLACLWSLGTTHARADKPEGLSPQTIKLPTGPSSMKGLGESFSVNAATGTGSFAMALELPPGFVKPELSFAYAGGRGATALGMGFDLPLVRIYRTTDKGSPVFTEQDRFAVSGPGLNDELVPVDAGGNLYRLKNEGQFALFVRDARNDTWTIRLADGHTIYLGENTDERELSLGRAYAWYQTRYVDAFGHTLRHTYQRDQGRLYLLTVAYQLEAAASAQNVVKFAYEPRSDTRTDYTYGDAITLGQRLHSVQIFHGTRLVRTYALSYQEGLLWSLLESVSMTGEYGEAMPPLTFSYLEPQAEGGEFVQMRSLPREIDSLLTGGAVLEDVTQDGLPDLLVTKTNSYYYYENIDGIRWSITPISVARCDDVTLLSPGAVLTDVDGDAQRDLAYLMPNGQLRYCPSLGVVAGKFVGFASPRSLAISESSVHFAAPQAKMVDLNSDGRIDLLYPKPGTDLALINIDDRFIAQNVRELPADLDFASPATMLADFNGDGVLDLVRNELGMTRSRLRVFFGLGQGQYSAENVMLAPQADAREFHLLDVNRDGQTDLVRVSGSWLSYYFKDTNLGFTTPQASVYGMPAAAKTRKLLWADMNGNGTQDAVWFTTDGKLYYLELMAEANPGLLSRIDNGMGMVSELSYRSSSEFAIDAKLAGTPWNTTLPFPHAVIDTMSVSDSFDTLGGTANVVRTSYEYHDGYYDGREREFRGFGTVITREWGDDAHATLETEQRFHVGRNLDTGADEEMLKHKPYLSIQRDEAGNVLHSAEVDWQIHWACREDLPGKPAVLPSCAAFGDLLAHKDELVALPQAMSTLEGHWSVGAVPRWVGTSTYYDEWGGIRRSELHGEIALGSDHTPGEPYKIPSDGVALGNDEIITEVDRAYDVAHWLIGIAYEERVLSGGGVALSKKRSYYDGADFHGLDLGQIERGKITRESSWRSTDGNWIDYSHAAYNADGLPSALIDANGNRRDLKYDPAAGLFPALESIAVAGDVLETVAEYDAARGTLLAVTDLNGHVTRYRYDGLGRIISLLGPDETDDVPLARYEYSFGTPQHPISQTTVSKRVNRATQSYRKSYLYSDGLGRTRLTKVEAEKAFGYLASDYLDLTARGAAARVYDVFPSSVVDFELPPQGTATTLKHFDALNRVTDAFSPATEDLPQLSTHNEYLPLETRSYGERDTSQQTLRYPAITRFDGQGRTHESIRVVDVQGSPASLSWSNSYDALSNLTAIVDPQGNAAAPNSVERERHTRRYVYDSFSHLRQLSDPNLGSVSFEYDDAGNMVHSIDALGQEQWFHFGPGNRLLEREVRGDAHGKPDYSYVLHYDRADPGAPKESYENLRGRLAFIEYPTGSEHYSYDARGERTLEVQTLWDPARSSFDEQERDTFYKHRSVDDEGALTRLELPGGVTIVPAYNERRIATQLTMGFAGDMRSVVSDVQYDAHGQANSLDFGNGLRTCRHFDRRGELSAVALGKKSELDCASFMQSGNTGVQNLRYHRSFDGNIDTVSDLSVPRPGVLRLDAQYEYDRLNQLVRSLDVRGESKFEYDAVQNLVRRTTNVANAQGAWGDFHYGERGAGPNALTSVGSLALDYDAAGRLENYRGFALEYDAEGHLVTARKDTRTLEFFYGPAGERKLSIVREAGKPARVHRFVFDEYEQRDGRDSWTFDAAGVQVELSSSEGVRVDARLLDELTAYLNGDQSVKPLPQELLDLNGDGKGFDQADLAAARQAFWNEQAIGTSRVVWRYDHADQLGSPTHVTDSVGDLVSFQAFEAYGVRTAARGLEPSRGFAGSRTEDDEDLGLALFGARYYAPELAHWISPDMHIGESAKNTWSSLRDANLYGYAANNPIAHRDPTGHAADGKGASEENMSPAQVQSLPAQEISDGPMCEQRSCEQDPRDTSGTGLQIKTHHTDKTGTITVYNGDNVVYAKGAAGTDLDGWRLADKYDHYNVKPGYLKKCPGGPPCTIKSGEGKGLNIVQSAAARDPRLKEDNPDKYISAVDYNYTTIPLRSAAFAGLKKGDAAVIRYKDHVVFALIGDIGNSNEFGENSVRAQFGLGFPLKEYPMQFGSTKNHKTPYWHSIGHDAKDVEYIYFKNTAHLLRDKDGVLLPQAQIDTIVKGLWERVLGGK